MTFMTDEDKRFMKNFNARKKYFQTKRKTVKLEDGTVLRLGVDTK